tara:strand:- start:31616 stop:31927 length:312 start_codon:yes stop_codon:yes gene_type:complete
MTDVPKTSPVRAAEDFMPTVEAKLNAWVEVQCEGVPALCCVWCDEHGMTKKQVVYVSSDPAEDILSVVRAINKSMKATNLVTEMVISLYESHNHEPVCRAVRY